MPLSPRVTVVVPLYNKAGCIARCLDSISAQTLADFEAIIVDDGSTDGGDAIAARHRDARFRVIRQENAGPGAARNRGIREARAPWVAFLDADDAWLPPFLETSAGILDRHPSAVSVSGGWVEYPQGAPCEGEWSARGIRAGICRLSPAAPTALLASIVPFMKPCTTVIRVETLRRCGGFQEGGCRFAEDGMLWLKLLLNYPVYLHLEPLVEIHREASSLSGNYAAARPLEPFLADPDELRKLCPAELRPLLERFYATRACRTACMLGYWGHWRQAAAVRREFASWKDWKTPLFFPALLSSTWFGSLAGSLWRRSRLRQPPAVAAASAECSRKAGAGAA